MRALDRRHEELSAYVVEACVACHWHHLRSVLPVGGRYAGERSLLDEHVRVVRAAREAPVLDLVQRDLATGRVPVGRGDVLAVDGDDRLVGGAAALAGRRDGHGSGG